MIDEYTNPNDKILSLMNPYIYPFTQRKAVTKYMYQGFGIANIPGARTEFLSDVLNNKPKIIAMFTGDDKTAVIEEYWHGPILEMMEKDYRLLSDKNGFNLYILNN